MLFHNKQPKLQQSFTYLTRLGYHVFAFDTTLTKIIIGMLKQEFFFMEELSFSTKLYYIAQDIVPALEIYFYVRKFAMDCSSNFFIYSHFYT